MAKKETKKKSDKHRINKRTNEAEIQTSHRITFPLASIPSNFLSLFHCMCAIVFVYHLFDENDFSHFSPIVISLSSLALSLSVCLSQIELNFVNSLFWARFSFFNIFAHQNHFFTPHIPFSYHGTIWTGPKVSQFIYFKSSMVAFVALAWFN